MDNLMQTLGKIREDRKISYDVLEQSTGIPSIKLMEAETGDLQLSIGELERLLAFYRMTPDQVLHYRKSRLRRFLVPAVAALVLLIGGYAWLSGHETLAPTEQAVLPGVGQTSPSIGGIDADSEQSELSDAAGAGEEAADEAQSDNMGADELSAGDPPSDPAEEVIGDSGEDAGLEGQEASAEDDTAVEAADPDGMGTEGGPTVQDEESAGQSSVLGNSVFSQDMVFRFWGNMEYDTAALPQLEDNDRRNVLHIIPIEQLTNARPDWLAESNAERFLLNAGTADIWTAAALEGWRQLQDAGQPVIGLGRTPDVYEPYIVEVHGRKIGFLSLAGLIHEAEQIALPSRIGLPRAYDNDEVHGAVERAKSKVDYLFVLIHWGNKRGDELPISKQERLAKVIVEAGGDFVIGNRSLRSQHITTIDGVPVFYSLGRSSSEAAADGLYNFVLDVHFSEDADKTVLRVGKTRDGVIRFDLTPEERERQQARLMEQQTAIDNLEIAF